jgi:mono/diheme cytochrome c family protein
MKRGSLGIALVAAILGLLASFAARILHDGMSARATPGKLEEYLARHAWRLSVPASARNTPNPVPPSAESLRHARLHFADHCAVCHGNDGSGDTAFAHGLYPKPPDLRKTETQSRSDGELFWIIENGVRFTGMPAFSSPGMQQDSWKLVQFVRHLPQLTAEERMEMSQNNPKNVKEREEEQKEDEFLNNGAGHAKFHGAGEKENAEATHAHP